MFGISTLLAAVAKILDIALWAYFYVMIARVLISWVSPDPYNPIVRFLYQTTEPVLYPIRRRLRLHSYGIDFSPLIAFFAIIFIKMLVIDSLYQVAVNLKG